MLVIDNDQTIHINRGDKLLVEFSIKNGDEDYTFKGSDTIKFSIYNKKGFNQNPVVQKIFEATDGETIIDIEISGNEMKIADYINKPVEYWYEIELNNDDTVVGYDQDGAKILMLYPEGMDIDVES